MAGKKELKAPKAPRLSAPIEEHKRHAEEVLAHEAYKHKPEGHPDVETEIPPEFMTGDGLG